MFVHEHYDIIPDIVVIGKGMGGGIMPIAAIIAREHLDVAKDISLGHYTHEKSALGCAAALATIEYIEQHGLLTHATATGHYIEKRLNGLKVKYDIVGDIRVKGMLAAIELVKDRNTKEKAVLDAEKVMYKCLENGLSFKVSSGNILTLMPPLITTEQQMSEAIDIVESAIQFIS
jgi:4-aminobutyrate aminotransferase